MPASLHNVPDLNTVFSLDCFHFNDLKKVISIILDNLGDLHDKFNNLNHKFATLDIPDTSKIMALIADLEKKQFECEKSRRVLIDDLESFKMSTNTNIDELGAEITNLQEKDSDLETRIEKLE